jgi:hypothetical protein
MGTFSEWLSWSVLGIGTEDTDIRIPIFKSDNKKICSIQIPLLWFYPKLEVEDSEREDIILWAWHQTFETKQFCLEHSVKYINENLPATLCVTCRTLSVKPVLVTGRKGIKGIQCENKKCIRYHIVIPWQMFRDTALVPEKYIPAGFVVRRQ